MQQAADKQFANTPFNWTIAFHLTDETAQYSVNCGSQGYMTATLFDRKPWDALIDADKKFIVTKLMAYVYGDFGSRKDVRVYFGQTELAAGNNLGCGSSSLLEGVQLFHE